MEREQDGYEKLMEERKELGKKARMLDRELRGEMIVALLGVSQFNEELAIKFFSRDNKELTDISFKRESSAFEIHVHPYFFAFEVERKNSEDTITEEKYTYGNAVGQGHYERFTNRGGWESYRLVDPRDGVQHLTEEQFSLFAREVRGFIERVKG